MTIDRAGLLGTALCAALLGMAWVERGTGMALRDSLMVEWVTRICAVGGDRYVALENAEEIPAETRLSSKGWFEKVLQPEANPYLAANRAKHSFSPGREGSPDLLCHEYQAKALHLVALETRNVIMVTVRLAAALQSQSPQQIDGIARLLLRMEGENYRLAFQYPETAPTGFHFSTNPAADISMLHSWHDRVDGFVQPQTVTFIFYKKVQQLLGYQNDRQWFSEVFKAKSRER